MENYRGLYKVPAKGASLGESKRGEKRENALREQKRKREDTFFRKRNIPENSASPAAPAPKKSANETRREKLLKWKLEKDRRVAQLKLIEKKKPPFKVGVAHHTLDPTKEFAPPVRATAVKCTTAKKAAAETRTDAAERRKANPPSVAAASLASLSVASSQPSSSFSGRVTRSRTAAAAAAASKAPPPSKPAVAVKAKIKPPAPPVSSLKAGKVASSRKVKEPEKSFAPKDHKFKAPASLTLPTTPITLKRNRAAAFKEANWPVIPGVSILEGSPAASSPAQTLKAGNRAASLSRGRLSRSVKQQTPKERKNKEVEIAERIKSPSPNKRKRQLAVEDTLEQVDAPKDMMETEIPAELPKPVKSRKSISKTRRMSRRTGGEDFIVTEISAEAVTQEQEVGKSPLSAVTVEPLSGLKLKAEETLQIKSTNNDGDKPKDSPITSSNSRKSKKNSLKLKEKENVPSPADILEPFQALTMSRSFSETDPIDASTADSRRMSIHEPSPTVDITPDKLSMGMVPAQFSPYITSARGKDKYSLQKRRNSLIPVVPDVSAEELAKSNQVEHFRNLLERESSRLLTVSKLWEERKDEAPSHAQDAIFGAIGQARLLVNDKFQQFKKLVDKFEIGESEGKITSDDLIGFWEMMLLTVENIDKRFKELEDLKANDWKEEIAIVPVKKAGAPLLPKPVKAAAAAAPSRLKSVIEAMRKRKLERKQNMSVSKSSDVATFNGGFFKVESPRKILPSPRSLPKSSPSVAFKGHSTPVQFQRRSLLQHVLTNSAVRAHKSPNFGALNKSLPLSPSPKVVVAQIRASQIGRRMSMDSGNDSYSSAPPSPVLKVEPTKSILKSAGVRRSVRVNTPRNRVAFHVLSDNNAGSPTLQSPEGTPPTSNGTPIAKNAGSSTLQSPEGTPPTSNGTPIAKKISTPGRRRRASLIPRPISTPGHSDRPSLLPMRESLIPSKPLEGEDLIDWSSPKSDSKPSRRSRQSNVH